MATNGLAYGLKFFIQLGRVDELGPGVINVYRYLKDYSPGREPQFIEDKIFETIIPIGGVFNRDITKVSSITSDAVNDAVNDTVNDAVSIQVRERLVAEIKWIQANGNTILKILIERFEIKKATGQRDMKILKDFGLIIFIGVT